MGTDAQVKRQTEVRTDERTSFHGPFSVLQVTSERIVHMPNLLGHRNCFLLPLPQLLLDNLCKHNGLKDFKVS